MHRGGVKTAEVDPSGSNSMRVATEPAETLIVRADSETDFVTGSLTGVWSARTTVARLRVSAIKPFGDWMFNDL
jgi:hypothetical protein